MSISIASVFRVSCACACLFLGMAASAQTLIPGQDMAALLQKPAAANPQALKAFPDYLAVRSEFLSALVTAPPATALAFKPAFRTLPAGTLRISVEKDSASFYVLFQYERNGTYPYASRGNIAVRRDLAKGYINQVKWFLSDDGLSYIILTPKNERTIVDYVVGGAVLRSSLPVGTLVYYFLMQSFSSLHDSLKSSINWGPIFRAAGSPAASRLITELKALERSVSSSLPAGEAGYLVRYALDPHQLEAYRKAIGKPDGQTMELYELPADAYAKSGDERASGAFVKMPAWLEKRGFAMSTIPSVLLLGDGSVYSVMVDAQDGKAQRKLIVVCTGGEGEPRKLFTFDAESRSEVDILAIVASRPDARARVFSLPAR